MLPEQFFATWSTLVLVVVTSVVMYLAVIAYTRVTGVRSLATMSSFDFAATVAVGSTIASTITGSVRTVVGVVALGMLFALQYLVARLRRRNEALQGLVDNRPILLMAGPEVLEENMQHVRLSRSELWSQLRLAGIRSRQEVRAVIMETTGDLSILEVGAPFDDELLDGVRGIEHLR